MGWQFRKGFNLGPLRINLSRSGLGCSVGVRGARIGKDAQGRAYSSLSVPNTGIYRRDYNPGARIKRALETTTPTPPVPVSNASKKNSLSFPACVVISAILYAIVSAIGALF
ncbi:MAG: DUF4236 domain-containing protein [Acidobacteriaceae bacterium]|nr:DUF4236 domain-containing protein [Acidobacteriaceae bacterium]